MKINVIRSFLVLEAVVFFLAALFHFGILTTGYEHQKAGTAETVIGGVLTLGLILSFLAKEWTHRLAMTAQGFALLGVFVGIIMITIGVGPRTPPDVLIHMLMVILLLLGLMTTHRYKRLLQN
ncbi:hypothetical protein [Bdellovibrio sp. HCB-162]|uniref:hypothetical protein n=1 Tax=Bdellovibrio sp. HCB-162 TaxID=3394234 RepID=UPI0039BC7B69